MHIICKLATSTHTPEKKKKKKEKLQANSPPKGTPSSKAEDFLPNEVAQGQKELEDALQEKIDAKFAFLKKLDPKCNTTAELIDRAKHIKILAGLEEELDLLRERQRVEEVVQRHREQHPPQMQECPICLEDIEIISAQENMVSMICCGKEMCLDCALKYPPTVSKSCPMCRACLIGTGESSMQNMMQCAERGVAWAQRKLGFVYLDGGELAATPDQGILVGAERPVDVERGVELLQLAADQDDAPAICKLANHYNIGEHGIEQDQSTARALYLKAANLGDRGAQKMSAIQFDCGRGGGKDVEKAVYYATLAMNHGDTNSAQRLGNFFCERPSAVEDEEEEYEEGGDEEGEDEETGLIKSDYLAKHYYKLALKGGCDDTYYNLAAHIITMNSQQSSGMCIPGHTCIPVALYLLRKGADNGDSKAIAMERSFVAHYQKHCANNDCANRSKAAKPEKLKQCVQCKALCYCCKECQVQHWKDGHKIDCVKYNAPLEDVLARI